MELAVVLGNVATLGRDNPGGYDIGLTVSAMTTNLQ